MSAETKDLGFEIEYMATSAKTGLNVDIAFEKLGKTYLDNVEAIAAQRK